MRSKVAQALDTATEVSIVETDNEGNQHFIEGVDISEFKLSTNQAKFVLEYINNGLNAMAAYSSSTNQKLNYNALRKKSQEYVTNEKIYGVLQKVLKNSINRQLTFSPSLLMTNIQMWLHFDIHNYYTSTGDAIPLDEIDQEARLLISGIEYTVNGRTGERYVLYKLPDKYKVLQELASIVKFLQSIQSSNKDEDVEAERKKKEIWEKFRKYTPPDDVYQVKDE